MRFMNLIITLLLTIASLSLSAQSRQEKAVLHQEKVIDVKVFEVDKGFGYDIFVDGKKYIHQTTIPSVPGKDGFATREEALKVGNFTAGKIKKNIMPPSVTPEELDSLKIKISKR